jgi:hypothetical protein
MEVNSKVLIVVTRLKQTKVTVKTIESRLYPGSVLPSHLVTETLNTETQRTVITCVFCIDMKLCPKPQWENVKYYVLASSCISYLYDSSIYTK